MSKVDASRHLVGMNKPPVRSGNAITFIQGTDAFVQWALELIEHAQEHIRIETYILADDEIGKRLELALVNAVQRGVQVQLVVDGFGSAASVHTLLTRLTKAGVQVRVFRPEQGWFKTSVKRLWRLHRKIIVIDRNKAIVGGINWVSDSDHQAAGEMQWNRHPQPLGPRYDFAILVQGPVVFDVWLATEWLWWQIGPKGQVTDSYRSVWWKQRASEFASLLQLNRSLPLPAPVGSCSACLVLRDNFRFRRSIEKAYLHALGKAHQEVWIACAYFFPGRKLRQGLIEAAKRGVRVHLLLQGLVQNSLQHNAMQNLYIELLSKGIFISEYTAGYLHAKVAVVDHQWCTVGSSNLDPLSLLLAREANLVVYDKTVIEQLRNELQRAVHHESRQVTLEHMNNRSMYIKTVHVMSYVIVRCMMVLTGRLGAY